MNNNGAMVNLSPSDSVFLGQTDLFLKMSQSYSTYMIKIGTSMTQFLSQFGSEKILSVQC